MTTRSPDSELVTGYLAGDVGAFGEIYDRYADELYDTASAMLSDRHAAADATREVFLVAAQRLQRLPDPDRLRPWLFAVLRTAIDRTPGDDRTVAGDTSADVDPSTTTNRTTSSTGSDTEETPT